VKTPLRRSGMARVLRGSHRMLSLKWWIGTRIAHCWWCGPSASYMTD